MPRILRPVLVSTTHALYCPACTAPTTRFLSMPWISLMVHTAVWPSLTQIMSLTNFFLCSKRLVYEAVSRPLCLKPSFSTAVD